MQRFSILPKHFIQHASLYASWNNESFNCSSGSVARIPDKHKRKRIDGWMFQLVTCLLPNIFLINPSTTGSGDVANLSQATIALSLRDRMCCTHFIQQYQQNYKGDSIPEAAPASAHIQPPAGKGKTEWHCHSSSSRKFKNFYSFWLAALHKEMRIKIH